MRLLGVVACSQGAFAYVGCKGQVQEIWNGSNGGLRWGARQTVFDHRYSQFVLLAPRAIRIRVRALLSGRKEKGPKKTCSGFESGPTTLNAPPCPRGRRKKRKGKKHGIRNSMMNRRGWRGGEFGAAGQMRQVEVQAIEAISEVPSSTSASPPHHLHHARDIPLSASSRALDVDAALSHTICSSFGSIRSVSIGSSTRRLHTRLHIRANPGSALDLDCIVIHHRRHSAFTHIETGKRPQAYPAEHRTSPGSHAARCHSGLFHSQPHPDTPVRTTTALMSPGSSRSP